MTAAGKWLTKAEAASLAKRARTQALKAVLAAYPEWPQARCEALLDACTAAWGRGPTSTAQVLVIARDDIQTAFAARPHCAGVLLTRDGLEWRPLFMSTAKLARLIGDDLALWVDVTKLEPTDA
jgi:hypothetical protein